MRPELIGAAHGSETDPEMLIRVLTLVGGTTLAEADVAPWAPLERAVVYDWAIREHLLASDNNHVKRRPKPALIEITEALKRFSADIQVITDSY